MDFEVYIVGSNSAISMHGRNPTAQAVQIKNNWFLIDCGEGTQVRMMQYHVKAFRIEHIFISHLHGDHYFGLIGLLTSYHLLKRTAPLTIYAPAKLEPIVRMQLEASQTTLRYPLVFVKTDPNAYQKIFENDVAEVFSFPLKHRIETTGFLFREKPGEKRLNMDVLEKIDIDKTFYKQLKQGKDAVDRAGNPVKSSDVTLEHKPLRSYAFCSDTMYEENLLAWVSNVDLLYHEATFMDAEKQRAVDTHHSTSLEAARIAKKANVKKLLLGHFSSRYLQLQPLLTEAKTVFENTELAIEGHVFRI